VSRGKAVEKRPTKKQSAVAAKAVKTEEKAVEVKQADAEVKAAIKEAVKEAKDSVKEEAKEEKKPVEKKADKKAAEVKAEVKAEETKPQEKETKRETKSAAKADAEPKASKKEPKQQITLQVDGRGDLAMNTLIDRVKAAYLAEKPDAGAIKDIKVYIKLSESMAYYVIDGYSSGINLY
jgi:hypothetical protein